jgi:Leucine-rich repeat (LRR) protein
VQPSLHCALVADPARAFSARRRRDEDHTTTNAAADAISRAQMHGLLDLRCCGLTKLPDDLSTTFSSRPLRVLDARYNTLDSLEHIAAVDSLVILNAAHNQLRDLPPSIAHKWVNLAVLNVSFNSLTSLPASLSSAVRLQQLYAANNQLTSLPEALGRLPIVDLFISENAFTCVAP